MRVKKFKKEISEDSVKRKYRKVHLKGDDIRPEMIRHKLVSIINGTESQKIKGS
jgi:hypothetical protein